VMAASSMLLSNCFLMQADSVKLQSPYCRPIFCHCTLPSVSATLKQFFLRSSKYYIPIYKLIPLKCTDVLSAPTQMASLKNKCSFPLQNTSPFPDQLSAYFFPVRYK